MSGGRRREVVGRLGFLFLSAACAIGLGNVWRFPHVTGTYGGAIFVGIFLLCLSMVLPIMIMEFAIGRAARTNLGTALPALRPELPFWRRLSLWPLAGSYLLMMFYTTVTGWLMAYCLHMASGSLSGLSPEEIGAFFADTLSHPGEQILGMTVAVAIGCGVCALGVRDGLERVIKAMMAGLLLILVILVARALSMPGAEEGLRFLLAPDTGKLAEHGVFTVVSAAMNQAFFTLSVGMGSMAIFGSYQAGDRSLTGEAACIAGLDTAVGLMAGLIIFPVCFAFGIQPNAGPGLIFVTLPNVFNGMPLGRLWGTLFFVFLAFAALTTVIAVIENIISYGVDVQGLSRRRASLLHFGGLWLLSLPCALGFNVLKDFEPLGQGTCVLDLEDFLVSGNILPLGGLLILLFCCHRRWGWGWDAFIAEVDGGTGMRFPRILRAYLTWVLPCIILFIFVAGYLEKFGK